MNIFLLCVAPVIFVGFLSLIVGLSYNTRHLVWISVPCCVVLATALASGPRRSWTRAGAIIVLLVATLTSLDNRNFNDRYRNEDVASAAMFVDESGEPAFVVSGYMARAMRFYSSNPSRIHGDDRWDARPLEAFVAIAAEMPADEPFLFLYTRPFHGDPDGKLLAAIRRHFDLTTESPIAGFTIFRATPLPID